MLRKPVFIVMFVFALVGMAYRAASQVSQAPEAAQDSGEPISGEQVFKELGCSACHDGSANALAPSLRGLYGEEVRLEGGEVALADEDYLRESILSPRAKIVDGYQSIMPDFQNQISDDQLQALIEFIRSLAD